MTVVARLAGAWTALATAVAASAQQTSPNAPPAGVVRVRVVHDSLPVEAALVRSGGVARQTNAEGIAELRLPSGAHAIVATRLGYRPDTLRLAVRDGLDTLVTAHLVEQGETAESIVVTATRSERRIEDTPLRVEVLDREEVEEKLLMTPGDISMMLNETGGLRVQTTNPSLGAANVRVQGLRGRYTLLLTDGLPLAGAQSGALGLLQMPPMDLAQVEVIKGVASALYGSSALGGVVNLVTRRPRDEPERELLVNGTTRGGADVVVWSSRRLTERLGYTLLGSGDTQRRTDVDGDGWTDMPGYTRAVVRPRLFWSGERGRSALVTVGTTLENRDGGTMPGAHTPAGTAFDESLDTRRVDAGSVVRLPFGSSVFTLRGSATTQRHRHQFGVVRERDRHDTYFAEGALATTRGAATWVVGTALQHEGYANRDVARFDYGYTIPALFTQVDVAPKPWLALSASGRLDQHSAYGTLVNPRVSILVRAPNAWTMRLSAGTGAFAPTPFTETTEATGLTPLDALDALVPERATSASLDLGGALGPLELNATAFGSRIHHALLVRPSADDATGLVLANATQPTRTGGADVLVRWHAGPTMTTASYTYVRSTEQAPTLDVRRRVPLTPGHTAGLTSVWEQEGEGRLGLEVYYTGRQPLDDDPYRATSRPYVVFGAIAERRFGRWRPFVNFENLGDVRSTRWEPLVRPFPGLGGRWTTDAWGPLEGRVINGGVRIDLGRGSAEDEGSR